MRLTQIAALCLAASLSTAAFANDKVAAVVNGTEIPQAELDAFAQQVVNSSGGRVKDSPELRAELKQQMINRTVILQEANRRGLEKTPEFKLAWKFSARTCYNRLCLKILQNKIR